MLQMFPLVTFDFFFTETEASYAKSFDSVAVNLASIILLPTPALFFQTDHMTSLHINTEITIRQCLLKVYMFYVPCCIIFSL